MTPAMRLCTQFTQVTRIDWERPHGYVALGVKDGDKEEDPAQPFWLKLLCDMITKRQIADGWGSSLLRSARKSSFPPICCQ